MFELLFVVLVVLIVLFFMLWAIIAKIGDIQSSDSNSESGRVWVMCIVDFPEAEGLTSKFSRWISLPFMPQAGMTLFLSVTTNSTEDEEDDTMKFFVQEVVFNECPDPEVGENRIVVRLETNDRQSLLEHSNLWKNCSLRMKKRYLA